jgi:hypothetical protein
MIQVEKGTLMKKLQYAVLLPLLLLSPLPDAHSQGGFILANYMVPTRLGTTDGPLAGPDIWGQALGGFTVDSLLPLGTPIEHDTGGVLSSFPTIVVSWAPIGSIIFVQMAAWNGSLWGTDLANVPLDQRGATDVVQVRLVSPTALHEVPQFTQSAIVPPVPEPTAFTFLACGWICVSCLLRWTKSR